MPPAKTELIDNKSQLLVDSYPRGKSFDESLLLSPALTHDRGTQQEGREPSKRRDEDLTTKRSKALSHENNDSVLSSSEKMKVVRSRTIDSVVQVPKPLGLTRGSRSWSHKQYNPKLSFETDAPSDGSPNHPKLNALEENSAYDERPPSKSTTPKPICPSKCRSTPNKTKKAFTEVRDDESASSLIGKMMSRPDVEVTNLSNGDYVDDTIVLSSSVLEALNGMDEDETILADGSSVKTAGSTVISTIKSVAASILQTAKGKAPTKGQEQNSNLKEEGGTAKHKTPVKCMTFAACVLKTTKETKTGLSINRKNGKKMIVTKIAEGGLFDSVGLKVGDEVLSVNNVATEGRSPREISTMIRDTVGTVTIVARRKEEGGAFPQGFGLNHASSSKERSPRRNHKQSRREPVVRFDGVSPPQETRNYKSCGKVVDHTFVEDAQPYQFENDTFSHHELLSVDEVSGMTSLSSGSMMTMTEFLASKNRFCCQFHEDCYYLLCGVGDEGGSDC